LPSFLVVQTSFLGDMVLTTPLLARLAKETGGTVDVVCTPAASALLANHPAVREAIAYDKRGKDRGMVGMARLAAKLRARRYDAAFLAQGSVRSGALTLMAGIPERIGFSTSAGRAFYTTRVVSNEGEHHAARLLSLADRGATVNDAGRLHPRPSLFPGDVEKAAANGLLRGVAASEPIVALAPGSIWATKRWPYYVDLARLLVGEARIVVIGGEADRPLSDEIADATGGRSIDATGRLSLLASAEVIGRARVLVTNDSAPLHLASAMNTPTVAVFGPTVPAFGFGPLAERAAVAQVEGLECRPCDRHGPRRCPLGHWRCMREITAGDVAALTRAFLLSTPRSS
jgi:lipopolysaccharide heptosyltransferase II